MAAQTQPNKQTDGQTHRYTPPRRTYEREREREKEGEKEDGKGQDETN